MEAVVAPSYVYMLANKKGGTLYTGSTTDIRRRMEEHRAKVVAGFTKKYSVTRLVYLEPHATIAEARYRERAIKRWYRAWKIALIERSNPEWYDLTKRL